MADHSQRTDLGHPPGPKLPLIAGGFLILFAIANSWLIYAHDDRVRWVEHTYRVQNTISGLQIVTFSTEAGVRDFLLAGHPAERMNILKAPAAFASRAHELTELISDNPAQVAASAAALPAGQRRLALLVKVADLRAHGQEQAALRMATQPASLNDVLTFRTQISAMRQREMGLLAARARQADRSHLALLAASAVTGLLTALFTAIWMVNALRFNTKLAKAYAALAHSNAQLSAEAQSRAQAENQIRQMQKMEAIGQLTGGIAHDFNNMLGVIIGNLSLIQRKLANGQTDVSRYADSALEGASRAAALTSRLLAFSRLQPLAPQPINVNRLLANLSEVLRRTLGEAVNIEMVQGGGLWRTQADPVQLESAIINLAVNARDAMNGAGKLTIETSNCDLDQCYGEDNDVKPGQYVLIAVTDTGSGMAPEVVERAFDPFFTTKPAGSGTGLGLSQVYGFIRQTQGHVKIYSEVGQGTTIKIYLPRLFGETEADNRETRAPRADISGRADKIILVVEDEDRLRRFAVEGLGELGYTVIEANSAQSAMAKLKEHPGVSLLLTDIVMPDSNGRALAEDAGRLIPTLPVLYMTGFSRNAVVHNGTLDPGVNFLAKPFTLEQLGAKVREVLDAAA